MGTRVMNIPPHNIFNCNCRRNFPAGICLSLIEEFDKVLNGETYSVLPLNRLCESNPTIAQGLETSKVSRLSSMTALAKNMLKRTADMPTATQEVITRGGLGTGTLDSSGNLALCRPVNEHREALGKVINKGVKRKANEDQEAADRRVLGRLSLLQLRELAAAEDVVLPEKARKADYVEAIYKRRNPPDVLVAGARDEDEEDMDVAVVDDENELPTAEEEMMEKKFLAVNNTTQLLAIVSKEKVVMRPGRKKKEDYINAIYLARHPSNPGV